MNHGEPTESRTPPAQNPSRRRVLLAWLGVLPLGIGGAQAVWASGIAGLCTLTFVGVFGPLILFTLARRSFARLGAAFIVVLTLTLIVNGVWFDRGIRRPLDLWSLAFAMAFCTALTFLIAFPVAIMLIPTPASPQSPPPASPAD